jgi:hypothetical protein
VRRQRQLDLEPTLDLGRTPMLGRLGVEGLAGLGRQSLLDAHRPQLHRRRREESGLGPQHVGHALHVGRPGSAVERLSG